MFLRLLCFTFISSIFGHPKIVLFNDTSHWYHWGCTGTSLALKEGIQRLGFEIHAIPISLTYSLKEVPLFEEFSDRQKFERFCEENPAIIEAINSSQAVIITGEGTIHDLRAAPRSLLYLAHISKKFSGKHVEIINHSAYPKDDPYLSVSFVENFGFDKNQEEQKIHAQEIYKKIYSLLDFIAIREPLSRDEMYKIGVSSTLSFDCLPLYIRDHYHTPKRQEKKIVVLAGSVAFSKEGVEKICRYLEYMKSVGFEIQVLIGAAAFPSKDDQAFVKYLKGHCTASWELVEASSLDAWLDVINHATLLVSGRFHHSIAAFCLDTPFIALNSNTSKLHAICLSLKHPAPLLFSDPDLLNQLLLQTRSILACSSYDQLDHITKMAEICQLAEKNFEGLRSFLEKKQKS